MVEQSRRDVHPGELDLGWEVVLDLRQMAEKVKKMRAPELAYPSPLQLKIDAVKVIDRTHVPCIYSAARSLLYRYPVQGCLWRE